MKVWRDGQQESEAKDVDEDTAVRAAKGFVSDAIYEALSKTDVDAETRIHVRDHMGKVRTYDIYFEGILGIDLTSERVHESLVVDDAASAPPKDGAP